MNNEKFKHWILNALLNRIINKVNIWADSNVAPETEVHSIST